MSGCPFSGVELHPKSVDLTKIRVKKLKIRVQRFRHVCLLMSYPTFFSKKTCLVQCKCGHSWAWKIQLLLSGKCSMVWSWAKTNEGLLVGFKSSHYSFAVAPNFHCVWLFASVNR